ncbi:MAG: hypothetical protein HOP08_15200 [Cyclobacteriaceae bacterium]|nr:hypothetical protein [Cyclobacteriaceae bacterium]
MVEIFKTNVNETDQAELLMDRMNLVFPDYKINFDLDDCDRILRVKNPEGPVQSEQIIVIMEAFGHWSEILEDEILVAG